MPESEGDIEALLVAEDLISTVLVVLDGRDHVPACVSDDTEVDAIEGKKHQCKGHHQADNAARYGRQRVAHILVQVHPVRLPEKVQAGEVFPPTAPTRFLLLHASRVQRTHQQHGLQR